MHEAVDRHYYERGEIVIKTAAFENAVTIEVADNEVGIPAAIQGRVFDPFFTTKDVGQGTGQGLSIACEIISSKHGGLIGVFSEEGEGAAFLITLPK